MDFDIKFGEYSKMHFFLTAQIQSAMCEIVSDLVVNLFILFVNTNVSLGFSKLCTHDFSRVSFAAE